MYVIVYTRPYITPVIGVVSWFGKEHWSTMKWILMYLKGTSSFSLYLVIVNLC